MKKLSKAAMFLSAACVLTGALAFAACGETPEKPEAHTHAYGETWTIVTPTDSAAGSATKVCTGCEEGTEGHEIVLTLPVLSDAGYSKTADTATCEEGGVITYSITVDGNAVSFPVATSAKGHTLGELHTAKAGNCEETGNPNYYECEVCHRYFADAAAKQELNALNIVTPRVHQYEEHAPESATCQKAGKQKYYTCENCGRFFNEEKIECDESDLVIPQVQHTKDNTLYTGAQISNHCTETYEDEHWYCTACGKSFNSDMVPYENDEWKQHAPLGHDFTDVAQTPAVPVTCTAPGMPAYYECNRCHGHYAENDTSATNKTTVQAIPATGHHWVSDGALGEPSAEGGKINVRCTNANCTEKKDLDYSGMPEQTGTNTNPVEIANQGVYFFRVTGGRVQSWFKIPITKAGVYRIEYINLDAAATTRVIQGAGSNSLRPFQVKSADGNVVCTAYPQGSKFSTGGTHKDNFTGDVASGNIRWLQFEADDALIGGHILLGIRTDGTEESPHDFLVEISAADAAPAEVSAQEYAVLPEKVTAGKEERKIA